ncbi:hypothetical protein D3C76_1158750 [compost metagenome]
MAQPAQPDDRQARTGLDVMLAHRRPDGDAGTQQRTGEARIQCRRYPQHETLAYHDVLGVTAAGHLAADAVQAVIGGCHALGAMRLLMLLAGRTLLAAVDHATDSHPITGTITIDSRPHGSDPTDDFMARHTGKPRAFPVVMHVMQVGMADAAEVDIDGDIVGAQLTAFEAQGFEGSVGFMDAIADAGGHVHFSTD